MTDLENEAFLFAEDLFSDCMSLHPIFQVYLPEHSPTLEKSSNFVHAVSRSIMLILKEFKKDLTIKFRRDFNSFSKDDAALKLYLGRLCDMVRDIFTCKLDQVLGLSAVLLELIAFLYRRGYTYFLSNAPIYWLIMFKNIVYDEFHEIGGWTGLTALSKELEIDYVDNVNAIYWMYWDSDLKPLAQPNKVNEKRSDSREAPSEILTDVGSGSVNTVKPELGIHSESKVGTDFEDEKPSNDPIIPETLEPTEQFPPEMTPKDQKALNSKEQGGNLGLSPSPKKSFKHDRMPNVQQKGSASHTRFSKRTTPDKNVTYRTKPDSSSLRNPGNNSPLKTASVQIGSKDTKSKGENADPSMLLSPKAAVAPKVDTSVEGIPAGQDTSSTLTSASAQNVPQGGHSTEAADSEKSAREKADKKGAPASSQKPTSAKKVPKRTTPRGGKPWR